jgi:hypothetical protein
MATGTALTGFSSTLCEMGASSGGTAMLALAGGSLSMATGTALTDCGSKGRAVKSSFGAAALLLAVWTLGSCGFSFATNGT